MPKNFKKKIEPIDLRNEKGQFKKGIKQSKRHNGGRKLFDGKDEKTVVLKLEQAYAIGASDEEACFYADISEGALYSYQKKNPDFLYRKGRLKLTPILQSKQTLVNDLKTNPENAKWYLVKKLPKEFGDKQEFIHKVVDLSQEAEKRLKKYEDK